MNNLKKIMTGTGIISALIGGSFYVGSEISRPECAYVIKAAQEVCLTQEQADALINSMATSTTQFGFDGVQFSEPLLLKK